MSLLVVGMSHRTAPTELLERATLPASSLSEMLALLTASDSVNEAAVLSTCNRIEVYVDAATFHGGVDEVSALIGKFAGLVREELTSHLYVHHDARAVAHVFSVASGLDSMVVGEAQILGQLRTAYNAAREEGATGRVLNELLSHALRVGKRAHAQTGIDRLGISLVSAGLALADSSTPTADSCRAVIVGAGSTGSLAAATLQRRGYSSITIANRTLARAQELAGRVAGNAVGLESLAAALADADVVVTTTAAPGWILSRDQLEAVMATRRDRPLTILDLALPRDVEPSAADLAGVRIVDLDTIRADAEQTQVADEVEAVRTIVTAEVADFLSWQQAQTVAPTVVALRSKAEALVNEELQRLSARLPELTDAQREAVEQAVRRVVDKLLHSPTVRVKQLAAGADGSGYANALRELFELGPDVIDAVSSPFPGELP